MDIKRAISRLRGQKITKQDHFPFLNIKSFEKKVPLFYSLGAMSMGQNEKRAISWLRGQILQKLELLSGVALVPILC